MDQTARTRSDPVPSAAPAPPCPLPPGYQACGAAATLLIKYPKAALVFQLGCVLSVHYWHVFNNSLARAAEGTPPSICCFNGPQHNCVHFGENGLDIWLSRSILLTIRKAKVETETRRDGENITQ